MPQDIRIWDIKNGNTIHELKQSQLDLEERIADWIEEDISFLSYDLLIIGRQITTVFGRIIDLAIHELVHHVSDGAHTRYDYMHAIQKRAGETVMLALEHSELFEQVEHEG